MELRVRLLWEYVDRICTPVLKSWLIKNSSDDGYANNEVFFDEVSLKVFEKLISDASAFYKEFIDADIDDKKKLEKKFGSKIRQQIKWSAEDLLKARGVITYIQSASSEEKTANNSRRLELMAIRDRKLSIQEREELNKLRKYDQNFYGYETESNDSPGEDGYKELGGSLSFNAEDEDSNRDIFKNTGNIANQPEIKLERLSLTELAYELVEECFDKHYSDINSSKKEEFIYMKFWDEQYSSIHIKDLAEKIGFDHSNPTQFFQRFLKKVNDCLRSLDALGVFKNIDEKEAILKNPAVEIRMISDEMEIVKAF